MRLTSRGPQSIRPAQPYFARDCRIYKQLKPVDIERSLRGRPVQSFGQLLAGGDREYMIVKGFKANRSRPPCLGGSS